MKNLKKVLALVLAFACAFTMFAGAVVYPDVPAGSEYSEAITMLSDLGIIQGKDDGKYHSEDTITRAEACALIARMLTGDPQVSQYAGASNFTDVVKGSWKESVVGYCVVNGITVGVGNNKFEPDRAITDAEFVTMVVRAMGYETTGTSYPYGHISAAQANGLLDDVTVVPSSAALRGEDAQIIYNALFADYARGAKQINTTHGTTVEEYPTIAEDVFGLYRAAVGTWGTKDDEDVLKNCKAHTWVIVAENADKDNTIVAVPIEDDKTSLYTDAAKKQDGLYYTFKYDGDIDAVKGYQVELWGEGQHGKPELETIKDNNGDKVKVYASDWEVKAVKTVKGQTAYDYDATMADSKSKDGSIKSGDIDVDLDSVASNEKALIKSFGDMDLDSYTDKAIEEYLNHKDADQYVLIDWDSDGDIDWITADAVFYYKVESKTSKRLVVSTLKADGSSTQETWKIDGINDSVEYTGADKVEKGDIIEVTSSDAYNSSEKETVTTYAISVVEPEAMELTKVSTKGDLQLFFDGEVIDIAETGRYADLIKCGDPESYDDFEDEELGTNFNLWRDRNGFIIYSEYADDNAAGYLMVLDTEDGSDVLPRKNAKVDVLLSDGTYKTEVEVASDLKLDQTLNGEKAYVEDAVSGTHKGRKFNEFAVVGHVYKYYTDADGVITKLKPVADDKELNNYVYDADKDRLTNGTTAIGSLEGADVIFAVTKDYIDYDSTGTGLYVDKDDVLVVDQADIPDIDSTGDTKPVVLDSYGRKWIQNTASKIVYDINDNKEISAAVMGVDSFDYFDNAAVKVGLVTAVAASTSDKNVTIDLAYDGKVEEDVEAVAKLKVSDIFEKADGTSLSDIKSVKTHISAGGKAGMYAEVSFNNDGKITKVVFMDNVRNLPNNRVVAYGKNYKVERTVINQVKTGKWVSILTGVHGGIGFAGKEDYYSLSRIDDAYPTDLDIASGANYYTFDVRPSFNLKSDDTKIKGQVMSIKNGFMDSYKVEAADENDLVASDVNDEFGDTDTYVTADLVSKKAVDGDIVAVYIYEDMGEVQYVAPEPETPNYAKYVEKAVSIVNPVYGDTAEVTDIKVDDNGIATVTVTAKLKKVETRRTATISGVTYAFGGNNSLTCAAPSVTIQNSDQSDEETVTFEIKGVDLKWVHENANNTKVDFEITMADI